MRRASIIAGALLLLAGCPLPQPLPEYPKGTVTPPRILMDDLDRREAVIRVPAGCTGTLPSYPLSAKLVDNDSTETVTARWFVDYDRTNQARCRVFQESDISGPGDGASDPTRRAVPTFPFAPYDHDPVIAGASSTGPGVVHVVELVVSNRFDVAADSLALCSRDTTTWPFRAPAHDGDVAFETQTFRWVFVSEPASAEVPCP